MHERAMHLINRLVRGELLRQVRLPRRRELLRHDMLDRQLRLVPVDRLPVVEALLQSSEYVDTLRGATGPIEVPLFDRAPKGVIVSPIKPLTREVCAESIRYRAIAHLRRRNIEQPIEVA